MNTPGAVACKQLKWRVHFKCLYGLGVLLVWALFGSASASAAERLIVSPQGPYTTIQAALSAAQAGDTIEVRGGVYTGNLVLDKSVILEGTPGSVSGQKPTLDAGGRGTVVTINAPDVTVRGFEIRNSGSEPDQDHAGITVNAPRALIEQNRLDEVLFGIFVAEGPDSIVRANDITSQARYESGRKGDGIRLWYSPRVTLENNHVHAARDLVIWYSQGVRIINNLIENGRYGVHLMYSDDSLIANNRLLNNSVGIYAMYSKGVELVDNDVRDQRGPSGYALGFKDTDNVTVENNLLVENRGGIFLDGTPFTPNSFARFENNILAFNDVAVTAMPAVKRVEFTNNTFWENIEQMSVHGGGGSPDANTWQGNFWSDYTGLDADGDGRGDTPYVAEKLFENMTDRMPILRVLLYSPAAQAIEFAAASFPIVKPRPKFADPAPRLTPAPLPATTQPPADTRREMVAASLMLLMIAAGAIVIAKRDKPMIESDSVPKPTAQSLPAAHRTAELAQAVVCAESVGKTYGKTRVLNDVSFCVEAGQALALWGPNGAGKTTLVKAMLGLISFQGNIRIKGLQVRQQGKKTRGFIGYVPQLTMFYDWSVQTTCEFYARLKHVPAARVPQLLQQLGLAPHASKSVTALSGGQKQRLALALALLADPPILLLDEPTANLDSAARAEFVRLVDDLKRQGKTILFASHRLEEVEALADRVLWLAENQPMRLMDLEEWRALVSPAVELTLWLGNEQRERASAFLNAQGWDAHLNGRGTIVVRARAQEKIRALKLLEANGFVVDDFQVERQTEVE
ncbi:MAG: nitrous oxide reductase family maturation protein NosD [Anaerolineae bacterium]|nr:nitrous oxide reductase family maturation protein NosD [Anaerolineae bacterium]